MKKLLATLLALTLMLTLAPMALAGSETKPAEDGNWDTVEIKDLWITATFSKARMEEVRTEEGGFFCYARPNGDGTYSFGEPRYVNVVIVAPDCTVNVFFNEGVTELGEDTLADYYEKYGVSSPEQLVGISCTMENVELVRFFKEGEAGYAEPASFTVEKSDWEFKDSVVTNTWLDDNFDGYVPSITITCKTISQYGSGVGIAPAFYFVVPEGYPMSYKGFTDVPASSPYHDAVVWATEKKFAERQGITAFGASAPCPRGEVVEILWKALGSPEPKSTDNPFTDVKETDSFYKAVLWAVENGITDGTSKTTFSPDKIVERCQAMTFIWRAANKPDASGTNPFTDVTDGPYFTAILWAVEKGITQGTSKTTFSPFAPVERGQMVTFLYRQLGK